MTSTPNLVLKLDINDVNLSLYTDIVSVIELFSGYEIEREEDVEMNRTYLRIVERGVELLFTGNKLSSIFLHITRGPENCGTFLGEIDLLPREIIDKKNDEIFAEFLESKGFVPPRKKYPFSVDRLNDELRIRLEQRRGSTTLLIDDGNMVR